MEVEGGNCENLHGEEIGKGHNWFSGPNFTKGTLL